MFPPPARYGWIRPRWFLAGLVLGLAALAWGGWRISRTDYHPGFVRFHSLISPEGNYYPTLDEMSAIVRAKCRPDQVLVIVGGNSILLGVWQREGDVWTRRLQDLLGDRYCVINFAFRGGSPSDGGAVVAESLRREFPRQVVIVNEAPVTAVEAFGREPYRYIFWQGYFGGKMLDEPLREAQIRDFMSFDPSNRRAAMETRISVWFDALFHYHDFWNWVTFEYFGTVASYREQYFPLFLKPRRLYPDPEVDGTDPMYDDRHYPPADMDVEMSIVRGPAPYYSRGPDGAWLLAPASRADLATHFDAAFPPSLKPRTLVLISGSSPYYRDLLAPDDAAMVRQSYSDTVALWRQEGYPALQYGDGFVPADFGDRIHLTKLGGWKLAAQVAPEVRGIAERLGYLK